MDCLTPWAIIIQLFSNQAQCAEMYLAAPPSDSIGFLVYIPYLLKTLVLELPFYYFFLKDIKSFKQILLINLVVNLATHPIIFILMPPLLNSFNFTYLNYLIIAEIFAPVVEAIILNKFYKVSAGKAWLAALVANLFSWGIGVYWS